MQIMKVTRLCFCAGLVFFLSFFYGNGNEKMKMNEHGAGELGGAGAG